MKKKILSIIVMFAISLMLAIGCGSTVQAEQPKVTEKTSNKNVYFWTDEETGVQYIIYSSGAGYCGMGGITPRLNSNGTPYIPYK